MAYQGRERKAVFNVDWPLSTDDIEAARTADYSPLPETTTPDTP